MATFFINIKKYCYNAMNKQSFDCKITYHTKTWTWLETLAYEACDHTCLLPRTSWTSETSYIKNYTVRILQKRLSDVRYMACLNTKGFHILLLQKSLNNFIFHPNISPNNQTNKKNFKRCCLKKQQIGKHQIFSDVSFFQGGIEMEHDDDGWHYVNDG